MRSQERVLFNEMRDVPHILVDGSNLVQKKGWCRRGKRSVQPQRKLRRKRTQYTSWENKRLVGAVLL